MSADVEVTVTNESLTNVPLWAVVCDRCGLVGTRRDRWVADAHAVAHVDRHLADGAA